MWTFNPIFKPVVWGGNKISAYKGIETNLDNIGESWELSGVTGSESVVSDGPDKGMTITELIRRDGISLLGKKNHQKFGDTFPLLIKFIDANADLSVQVHPSDELAQKRGIKYGKTEMWYVVEADHGARLANGFNRPIDDSEYVHLIETGEIMEVLNFNNVKQGDVFYIPAGRVHAIGTGCFIVEIQQTSDTTYRLYDYHRKDKDGNERQLHTEEAFDAINFNDTEGKALEYTLRRDLPVNLVASPFFTTNVYQIDHEVMRDYSEWDTFVVIICIWGAATVTASGESVHIKTGQTILIPASCKSVIVSPEGVFEALETFIK
ncbi:MAG: mannose-6-phosphate isomerase [Bacteroides sp.]|nr:mannose-6-phosphate isomerase [Bacteroides sp.]